MGDRCGEEVGHRLQLTPQMRTQDRGAGMPALEAQSKQTTMSDDIVLRVDHISKSYGPVRALEDVCIAIRRGTIHGLLGENGAGKSTLVGIISGQRAPTSGHIVMDGRPLDHVDIKTMEKAGVFLVHQEPMIVDNMSVAENLMMGLWPKRGVFIDRTALARQAVEMLADTGINPDAPAGRLDAVARRKLNILRAMFSGGKVIILDEPTASLTVEDRKALFAFMTRLRDDGVTFIFISHYNDEILDICDAVSVLRDGRVAGGADTIEGMTSEQLTELVIGHEVTLFARDRDAASARQDGPLALRLRDVSATALHVAAFDLAAGEIVGFTGLPGAGAKELGRAMFGILPAAGTMTLAGGAPQGLPTSPRDALDQGIAFLSDDRRRDGAVGPLSIGDNIALSSLGARSRNGFVDQAAEDAVIDQYFRAMDIKSPGPTQAVDTLSGGNQQKVCLGRVLATKPRVLVVDEPTRGIDIAVKQDVLRILDALTGDGVAVILISSDTDELIRVADRVCVFENGGIHETLRGAELTLARLRGSSQA